MVGILIALWCVSGCMSSLLLLYLVDRRLTLGDLLVSATLGSTGGPLIGICVFLEMYFDDRVK